MLLTIKNVDNLLGKISLSVHLYERSFAMGDEEALSNIHSILGQSTTVLDSIGEAQKKLELGDVKVLLDCLFSSTRTCGKDSILRSMKFS